jgi:hypothetical protein
VLYASSLVYKDHDGGLISAAEHAGWALKLNTAWERKLQQVNDACRRVRGLTSLLISLHPKPVYRRFWNEEKIVESLKAITAAPTLYVEVLGGAVQGKSSQPFLLRSGGLDTGTCKPSVY